MDVESGGLEISPGRKGQFAVLLLLAIAYLSTLTPGHAFGSDDFAAYVMHAANLVEGRPYTDIRYVPNPKALWLAPSNGYPPIYPMILAPVYRIWGLNLRALKVITVLCFLAFLWLFAEMFKRRLSVLAGVGLMLIVGFNPVFWEQRNYVLSEFPYLMFSFGALLVIQNAYADLEASQMRMGTALLLAVLLYCAYGTRTIGIVLLPALVLADLLRFKRPSRFLVAVLAITAILIAAQSAFLTAPRGYLSAVEISAQATVKNALYYSKTLSYVWQNGFNKGVQIAFALLFTGLACSGFVRKLWTEKAAGEFYVLGYLAILFMWSAEIGLRGLLPILPLYVAYGLEELSRVLKLISRRALVTAAVVLASLVGSSYVGEARRESRIAADPDVQDASAQQLFAFLRAQTQPSDVLIFSRPRSLALFTNRRTASFAPDESAADSYQFAKDIHSTLVVVAAWSPPAWKALLESQAVQKWELFSNSEYQVFQIAPPQGSSVALHGEK